MTTSFHRSLVFSALACASVSAAALVSALAPSDAYANPYSCQADLVLGTGQIVTSSIGEGFSQRQACQNALSQCQSDLETWQQQGYYQSAYCRISTGGGHGGGNGPVTPFPPSPGPFPPSPGPFPPGPGNYFEISCSSFDYNVNYCYVGYSAYQVRLLQQYTAAPCRLNRTFGLQGDYMWVSNGCSARFRISSH